MNRSTHLYNLFEVRIPKNINVTAFFTHETEQLEIAGFVLNETESAVRFMPARTGDWSYILSADGKAIVSGSFQCLPPEDGNHGHVKTDGYSFTYADGTYFAPLGTTCYAWTHQPRETIDQTLETLAAAPFNKIRMGLFPKHMPYNHNEPEMFPFHRDSDGKWDIGKPDFRYWTHLDEMLTALMKMGIEADLILFHPYDRWGLSALSREENLAYLDYALRRLSAYRNIWWSLANEYDLVYTKNIEDWDAFGEFMAANDPHHHLLSIHHCFAIYPKRDWMTHCSLQNKEVRNAILEARDYNLPLIIDECGYEGNLEFDWGNLSGFELMHRAWTAVSMGAFITHGETFHREDEVLWWAKGGVLHGETAERFRFLKEILYEIGTAHFGIRSRSFDPNNTESNTQASAHPLAKMFATLPETTKKRMMYSFSPALLVNENCTLQYLGRACPIHMQLTLPKNGEYRVETLDIWEMTRTVVLDRVFDKVHLPLPAKEGIAILITRLSGESLDN